MRVAATPASSVVGIVAGVIGTLRLTAESRIPNNVELVTLLASKLRRCSSRARPADPAVLALMILRPYALRMDNP